MDRKERERVRQEPPEPTDGLEEAQAKSRSIDERLESDPNIDPEDPLVRPGPGLTGAPLATVPGGNIRPLSEDMPSEAEEALARERDRRTVARRDESEADRLRRR